MQEIMPQTCCVNDPLWYINRPYRKFRQMRVYSLDKDLEELAGKKLTKIVLIYDRSGMPPHYTQGYFDLWLKATRLPLQVFVHSGDDILADYSFDTTQKSVNTWTIVFKAHSDMLFTILKKALTEDGPKHYNFTDLYYHIHDMHIELAYLEYKDLYISCQLRMNPPKVIAYEIARLRNGEYRFKTATSNNASFTCIGYHTSYLERIKPPLKT